MREGTGLRPVCPHISSEDFTPWLTVVVSPLHSSR